MSTGNAPAEVVTPPAPAKPAAPALPSWPWRLGAFLLAGAAQLITISALVGVNPPPVTWATLLLAIAPAPLAAAAAFTPAPLARLAAAAAAVVAMAAGLAGSVTHTGLFFLPAVVVEIVATAKLWSERGEPSAGVQRPKAASQAPTMMNSAPTVTNALSTERPQRP